MAKANIQKKVNFHLRKGALHSALKIPPGKPIPLDDETEELAKAKKSGNIKLEREAQFAINARKFKH